MISVIDDDEHVYHQFIDLINGLPNAAHVVCVNDTPRQDMLRYAQGRAPLPSSQRHPSARDQARDKRSSTDDVAPAAFHGLLFEPSGRGEARPDEALHCIQKLASQGASLVRMDEVEPMTISTSLARFRKAGIIAPLKVKTIRAGITVEDRRGYTLSLLPDGVRDRRTELRQTTGRLAGRFSIDVLGVHWMPLDWQRTFQLHWTDVVQALGLVIDNETRATIKAQIEGMRAELAEGSHLHLALMADLRINAPAKWKERKARRILASILRLKKDEPLPEALSAKQLTSLRALIWEDVRGHIGRRLQYAYVLTQLEQAGLPPLFRPFAGDRMDERDALLWLAQWTLSAIGSEVRSPQGREGGISHLPNRNGIGEILAEQFGRFAASAPDVHEAYHFALRWKQIASGGTEQEEIEQSLAEAWMRFADWFGMSLHPIQWTASIPAWSMGEKAG